MHTLRQKIAGTIKAGLIAGLAIATTAFGAPQSANAFTTAPGSVQTLATTTAIEQVKFRGGHRGGFRGNRGFRGRSFSGHRGFRGRGFANRGFRSHRGFANRGFNGRRFSNHRNFKGDFNARYYGFTDAPLKFKGKKHGFKGKQHHGFNDHGFKGKNIGFGSGR